MADSGWFSTIGGYVGSASVSVGSTAKSVWNSETLASGITKVEEYAGGAAKVAGTAAQSAWNSDTLASGTSAVKSGVDSAATGISTWWNTPREKEENKANSVEDACRGTALGMGKNASKFHVSTAGRSSNIVNFFDKSSISSRGNPRWLYRYDMPHGNVPNPHINVNPMITKVPDPHIPISGTTAKTAGYMGKVAEKMNDVAPYLTAAAMAYEGYKVAQEVKKDYDNGTTRNTIEKVSTTGATYASAYAAGSAGASAGTMVLPGIGTFFGGLAGAVLGGYYGGKYTQGAVESTLDHYEWDTADVKCQKCSKVYKKYQGSCGNCVPGSKL